MRTALLGVLLAMQAGCALEHYREAPLDPEREAGAYLARRLDDPLVEALFLREGRKWPPRRWDGEALVLAARALNNDLAEVRAGVAVAEAGVIRAGGGIDPVIGLGGEHHTLEQAGSLWSLGGFLELVFQRPARRQARIDRALAELAVARAVMQEAEWRLRAEVLGAWETLLHRQRMTGLQRRRVELLERMEGLLERRHELGESGGFELDSMRMELLRARLEMRRNERELHAAWRELARRVGVTEPKLRDAVSLPVAAPTLPDELPPLALVQRNMLHGHAAIRRGLLEYARADAELRLAIEAQYPDLKLSPGYLFDQGDNIWSLATSLAIPLARNHTGAIEQARRRRAQEAVRFRALQAELIAQLDQAHGNASDVGQGLAEARALLRAARGRERRMRRSQEMGQVDALSWLRSSLQTLEAETAVETMMHESRLAWLRLEQSAQLRFDSMTEKGEKEKG